MIQRIQSLYLFISIICLTIVTFGMTVYRMEDKVSYAYFSAYGLEIFESNGKLKAIESSPYYVTSIGLILLCLICIFSYKNVKNQLRVGRIILLVYLINIIMLLCYRYFASPLNADLEMSVNPGLGFFLFVAGFPFIFLANIGIKRDKNLLDSLNRLR